MKIADILKVSLDELVGRSEPTTEVAIRNHALHELVQEVDALPDEDQRALMRFLDGLVKKSQLDKVMRQRPSAGIAMR